MKLILLSGKQGSGKTETALKIKNILHKHDVQILKYASILYEMHDAIKEIAEKYGIWKYEVDKNLLQVLGTEWGRKHLSQDVWVQAMQAKLEQLNSESPESIFIIDDCRFKNEFHAFPMALRVRLICDKEIRMRRCADHWRNNSSHSSETDLDDIEHEFDMRIHTDDVRPLRVVAQIIRALEERHGRQVEADSRD